MKQKEKKMKIKANNVEISIDEKTLKNLVLNCLDSSDQAEIKGVMYQIAEAFYLCDSNGNPTFEI